jgi:ATP-dependent Lon protease
LLKILHPGNKPTDEEFDEYVSYAVESRRRIKEQMNKRKSDDEFSKINLSFFDKDGSEVVVFCPESKTALATQEPTRRDIHENGETSEIPDAVITVPAEAAPVAVTEVKDVEITTKAEPLPSEQHFTIYYGDTGHSYESLIAPYLNGAKAVEIEDPYIRATHQVHNFVRFCEAVIKTPTVRKIVLITSYDNDTDVQALSERLSELKQSLLDVDIELDIQINEHMHDREIRIDNGWTVKIGRGLDFYQKPDSWFGIGSNDLLLRKCLETKVDIFQR